MNLLSRFSSHQHFWKTNNEHPRTHAVRQKVGKGLRITRCQKYHHILSNFGRPITKTRCVIQIHKSNISTQNPLLNLFEALHWLYIYSHICWLSGNNLPTNVCFLKRPPWRQTHTARQEGAKEREQNGISDLCLKWGKGSEKETIRGHRVCPHTLPETNSSHLKKGRDPKGM